MAVETSGKGGYLEMLNRMIRRAGVRVAEGDEVDFAELLTIQATIQEAIRVGAVGIHDRTGSWEYVGKGAGITREAAWKRWGKK